MKVLIVYAHPNPKSFNHAVLEEFTKGLKDSGHTYEVVDLHAIKFDPSTNLGDFVQFTGGKMPNDVLAQQEKVSAAEALTFIFPRLDWTYPAILKGWIQRVFSFGFAYMASKEGVKGLLKNKKVLLINTAGAPEEFYKTSGLQDAFMKIYNMTFKVYSAIPQVDNVTFYGLMMVDEDTRKEYLKTAYKLGKEF